MKDFLAKSLRRRLILLALIIVSVPILVAGLVMEKSAEQSLLDEKKNKLAAIAYIVDVNLGEGGFDKILSERGALGASRQQKIEVLNQALTGLTDSLALSAPGLGVGFYSRDLDAIITYSPSDKFGYTVGQSIGDTHPGREVMETNELHVEFGSLVRGNILNAMRPLARDGRVIGYIFVNELTGDIHSQVAQMDRGLVIAVAIGLTLSILLILRVTEDMVKDVQTVIRGLRKLRFNLREPITGVSGELGEIASTINDMASALGNARTLSENIMDSIGDGVISVDTVGKITAFNRAAETLTGYAAVEAIGKHYGDLFAEDASFHSRLLDTLQTGQAHFEGMMEYPVKNKKLWISVTSSVLKDIDGNILGAVTVFKDLTERKQLEDQVSHADRLAILGELMAGVAHEIRNPLTSIKGFLQYFQNAGSAEERAQYLPMLIGEVDRMNRIIETMLYFSRPCQKVVVQTDVTLVLQETLFLVQSRAKSHGVRFEVAIEPNVPLVNLDGEQFKQVFLNLLINSLQAIDHEGKITVSAQYLPDTDEVEMTFADTGPGIPHDIREKVFDPFFTTKQAGTGLGLAVTQRIVIAQGGTIDIGDNPGGGALIRIVIPRAGSKEDTIC
ncbi:MAG: signal transduction histidine kinase, nitrogen specific, NtrB [Anaerosporomusa subterranea]|jgi:two-component system sensor histidine kinase AtoS|nr:signal transduction histidine kinase, nitrogen specific, NtrB [Anaerosporomusa subterranea]